MSKGKKTVAVFFGGPSPEHDVSVVTGLQVLGTIDPQDYDAFPVYISPDGRWFVGEQLRDRKNYLFDIEAIKALTQVTLDLNRDSSGAARGKLLSVKKGLFGKALAAEFDIALPAFHGLYGEDGNFQGLMEFASIPYVGMRTMAASILMDKVATKQFMQSLGIPVLPYAELRRAGQGTLLPEDTIEAAMKAGKVKFPCILKPSHLGSSIGVAKVKSTKEIAACLPAIFAQDNVAILEPFVENLAEYNVSVMRIDGKIVTSAIERPKNDDELLDFKKKYMSGGGSKNGGTKTGEKSGQISQGMLSLTRDLNPKIAVKMEKAIRDWATTMFDTLGGTGAPRIDCIANDKTGDIWLNEVNPFPGSIGYFLWEAAEDPLLFSELLTNLLQEAMSEHAKRRLPHDPVPRDARLLKRALSEG
jgi:D-alanine-D-alanine ligase